jgi:hypothetical protein
MCVDAVYMLISRNAVTHANIHNNRVPPLKLDPRNANEPEQSERIPANT